MARSKTTKPFRMPGPVTTPQPLSAPQGIPPLAILPLRFFLGMTFVYAGFQKLADPGFLSPAAASYIGHQIQSFGRGSPISALMSVAGTIPIEIGILTIATELAIGILILLGLFTRLAALTGMALNVVFYLSASWHVYPYFMGADIVWVGCWLTLFLTGPGPYALDSIVQSPVHQVLRRHVGDRAGTVLQHLVIGAPPAGDLVPVETQTPSGSARRDFLFMGMGAILVALGLWPRGSSTPARASATGSSASSGSVSGPASNSNGAPTGSKKIGHLNQLPVNSAGTVTDPHSGDPAIVVRPSGTRVYAYDAVCTHAGCTVQYDPQSRMIVCPCHGATYDPVHDAQVVAGPAPTPLTRLPVSVDSKGNIYLY